MCEREREVSDKTPKARMTMILMMITRQPPHKPFGLAFIDDCFYLLGGLLLSLHGA